MFHVGRALWCYSLFLTRLWLRVAPGHRGANECLYPLLIYCFLLRYFTNIVSYCVNCPNVLHLLGRFRRCQEKLVDDITDDVFMVSVRNNGCLSSVMMISAAEDEDPLSRFLHQTLVLSSEVAHHAWVQARGAGIRRRGKISTGEWWDHTGTREIYRYYCNAFTIIIIN